MNDVYRQLTAQNDQFTKIRAVNKQCLDSLTKTSRYELIFNFFDRLNSGIPIFNS